MDSHAVESYETPRLDAIRFLTFFKVVGGAEISSRPEIIVEKRDESLLVHMTPSSICHMKPTVMIDRTRVFRSSNLMNLEKHHQQI